MSRLRFLLTLLDLLLPMTALAAAEPITIAEILPSDKPGWTRTLEPVTFGFPLPQGAATRIDQLSLGMPAQFRGLDTWPDGSLRWVLIDTAASVSPKGNAAAALSTVPSGGGNPLGPALASEQGGTIRIDTGAAQFTVRKAGFNGLESATVNGVPLVPPHADGGLEISSGGALYTSALDAGSEVAIEENGPLKAVIDAKGTATSASGGRSFLFTVRLYFYKGSSAVKTMATLRNAALGGSAKTVDWAQLRIPLALSGSRTAKFSVDGGTIKSGPLDGGQVAWLYQGKSPMMYHSNTERIAGALTGDSGVKGAIGSSGFSASYGTGWGLIEDAQGRGVLVGVRNLAVNFPDGIEVGDSAAGEIFSKRNSKKNLAFSWGAWETREFLFDFYTAARDPDARYAFLAYPLFGRATNAAYLGRTGAYLNHRGLASYDDMRALFSAYSLKAPALADIKVERYHSYPATGGPNQMDISLVWLHDYLRTGHGGWFLAGQAAALWKADSPLPHSDGFDYGLYHFNRDDPNPGSPSAYNGAGADTVFDHEHPHWIVLPLYYLLTGDEHIREAIVDYGEWRRMASLGDWGELVRPAKYDHLRRWSRALRDLAIVADLTKSRRELDGISYMLRTMLDKVWASGGAGRSLDRGFLIVKPEFPTNVHVFFHNNIQSEALWHALSALPRDDPLWDDTADYYEGLAWFTALELTENGGHIYDYDIDNPGGDYKRADNIGYAMAWGYLRTGDPVFLDTWKAVMPRTPVYEGTAEHWGHLGSLSAGHFERNRAEVNVGYLEPQVGDNGGGSYTLSWTVPAGARAYQIKHGAQPLKENLNYNKRSKSYEFSPDQYDNFWAATNLAGEPAPGAAGTTQTWTVTGLAAGQKFLIRWTNLANLDQTPPPPPAPSPPSSPLGCGDGTPAGACSAVRPLQCSGGQLITRCQTCGCPAATSCQADGRCAGATCQDGTAASTCAATQPFYCDGAALVSRCRTCGCGAGLQCSAIDTCEPVAPRACADGTPWGACAPVKPGYCDAGTTVIRCSVCGCPTDTTCQPNGTCAGTCQDTDRDGAAASSCGGPDCQDSNAAVLPGAPEQCGNARDDNCDGAIDEGCSLCADGDQDGYFGAPHCPSGTDCDDTRAAIHPSAAETCGNGIDEDCDGRDAACRTRCADGTPEGACNSLRAVCRDGSLQMDCQACPCPAGQDCLGGRCVRFTDPVSLQSNATLQSDAPPGPRPSTACASTCTLEPAACPSTLRQSRACTDCRGRSTRTHVRCTVVVAPLDEALPHQEHPGPPVQPELAVIALALIGVAILYWYAGHHPDKHAP